MERQPAGRVGAFAVACLLAAVLPALAGCDDVREPRVTVSDLNWACGPRRCTATFQLAADERDEPVVVRVRAYAGEDVASREIVGETAERLTLRAGTPRRLSVAIDTRLPATRVRVVVGRDS
jgi:hypothetical protein